jgi:hypothetical protein
LKGKWSIRRRQGFHSTLTVSFTLHRHATTLSNWYNISLIFTCTDGGESNKGLSSLCFWRLLPKGEKILSPKQKDRTPPYFQNKVFIDVFHIGIHKMANSSISIFKGRFSKLISNSQSILQLASLKVHLWIGIYFKTLLKAKRRISFKGSFI